ncbi:hypothetical protein [Salinispira pacifica]
MALHFGIDVRRGAGAAAAALLVCAALLSGCAGGPASTGEAAAASSTKSSQQDASAAQPTGQTPEKPAAAPAGPAVYFVDGLGKRIAPDAAVSLPTGAPPVGRLYPRSDDAGAKIYVTVDGTIPTESNNWAAFTGGSSDRYISSLEAKNRTYRIAAVDGSKGSGPIGTYVVTWFDEEKPAIEPPRFVAGGTQLPAGASVTLPTGGETDPAGRLSVTCNYLGATLFITRDGSDPSPKNFWKSDVCDGTYIFSANAFTTSYKVMAVLRGTESGITSVTVTWKSP